MSLNQIVSLTVPSGNGLGAATNVATMTGNKSVEVFGTYVGRIVLLGSHDGVTYVPLAIFDSGAGIQAYKKFLSTVVQFLRVRRETSSGGSLTMVVSSETSALNNFISVASLNTLSTGIQPSIDLWTLVPATGLNKDFSIFAKGDLAGSVIIEGSSDNITFNPLGIFTANSSKTGVLEFSPLIVPDVVRYLRVQVSGRILSSFTVTLGGEQNTASAVAGKGLLKFTADFVSDIEITTVYMADPGELLAAVVGDDLTTPQGYPMPACTVSSFIIKASVNNRLADVTARVLKNGVVTAIVVLIPAGSTAVLFDLVNTVVFAAGDLLDIRLTSAADDSSGFFAATLEAAIT
jgi:hypothetical protein